MASRVPVKRDTFGVLLAGVKQRIQAAQTRAVLAVNSELVRLYWDIGRLIDQRQRREGWGAAVIPRLAAELKNEMPELKGFSERNIGRMIAFHREYQCPTSILPQTVAKLTVTEKVPQLVAQIPDQNVQTSLAQLAGTQIVQRGVAQSCDSLLWSVPWAHHVILMDKVPDLSTRHWYMEQTLANGWSRNILAMQIEAQAHARHGKVRSNFALTLPPHESDLVQQTLKDPYIFDFLTLLAEYSFAGIDKPIGISTYKLTRALPKEVCSALPTVEEIEAELGVVARNAKTSRTKGGHGGLECRESWADYGAGSIAIVPAPFDATDGADTPFGHRWGGKTATLSSEHLTALKDGKTLAFNVHNEYVQFVKVAGAGERRPKRTKGGGHGR